MANNNKIAGLAHSNKRETFLHDMVTIDFFGFRNVAKDFLAQEYAERIRAESGRNDGTYPERFARRIVYTEAMYFNWHPETPAEYRNLEELWRLMSDGIDIVELYLWSIENIPNPVTVAWEDALENAHTLWKKPIEKSDAAESSDPNS